MASNITPGQIYGGLPGVYYFDSNVSSGNTYYYEIAAVTSAGTSAKSNEVSVTYGAQLLPAPATITANAGNQQVVLNWSTVTGATSYNLYRSVSGGSSTLYQVALTANSYTDTGLTNGTVYSYCVAAVGSGGTGYTSQTVSATPGGTPPAAPTGLWAAPSNSYPANALSWNETSGVTSYNVYRSTTPGGEGSVPIAMNIPPGQVYGGFPNVYYFDSAETAGVTYYYEVTAVSSVGESGKSNEAAATFGATLPPAPATITASSGTNQIALLWTTAGAATSYNLYRNVSGGAFSLYQLGLTSSGYTDTSVTSGTTYGYYVDSVSLAGQGSPSNTAFGTPGGTLPAAPTGLTAMAAGSEISLAWNAVTGANSYNIYRSVAGQGSAIVPLNNGPNSTTYTDTDVTSGVEYTYWVTALNAVGEGPESNVASAELYPAITTGFLLEPHLPQVVVGNPGKAAISVLAPAAADFSGDVDLTCYGVPTGVTSWFYGPTLTVDPTSHFGNGTDLWFVVSPSATPGTYPITITGTASSDASYAYSNSIIVLLTIE